MLLYQLSKCGIHLMPIKEDATVANITPKDDKCEDAAIADVVSAVRSFFIKYCRFSYKVSEEKIICRIRENLEYDLEFHED